MTGRVEGKVAFITGAARGQGRSHALRLAEEGADIIAVDAVTDYASVPYSMARPADLDETCALVRARNRRIVAGKADVRDQEQLRAVLDTGVAELGHLDIVVANAGICTAQAWDDVSTEVWSDTIDTNLTGVWNTIVVAAPHLIANGGGSVIATSSVAGIKGLPFFAPYVAAKHGIVGIARSLANELASHHIRVNTVHPAGVDTAMSAGLGALGDLIACEPNLGPIFINTYPVEMVDLLDVINAVMFLACDESRYVTGLELTIDGGNTIR
ncbi:MAG: short-chain dehydrogenase/reductase [Pseudonocardiales bacterium]|nr:short-chain dehydrogenase/reductase [Pseudonocardiales bacterium]